MGGEREYSNTVHFGFSKRVRAERETLVQAQLFINELTRYRVIPVASRKYTRALVIDVTIMNRFNKRNTIIPEYSSAFLSFLANRD